MSLASKQEDVQTIIKALQKISEGKVDTNNFYMTLKLAKSRINGIIEDLENNGWLNACK